jgi:hypothetical protein
MPSSRPLKYTVHTLPAGRTVPAIIDSTFSWKDLCPLDTPQTAAHPHHRLGSYGRLGIMLTAIGALLAIDAYANVSFAYKLWPLLVVIMGTGFIGIHIRRGRNESLYVGVGTFLCGFGLLALYCSFTSWAAMGILWPLFIAFFGISLCVGYFAGARRPYTLLAGLLFLLISATFLLVFSSYRNLWWIVFFMAGPSFLVFDRARRRV